MQEANIGDLHLSFDGKRLAVAGLNAEQAQASLDGSEIEQLYRFLGSIVGISPQSTAEFPLGSTGIDGLGGDPCAKRAHVWCNCAGSERHRYFIAAQ